MAGSWQPRLPTGLYWRLVLRAPRQPVAAQAAASLRQAAAADKRKRLGRRRFREPGHAVAHRKAAKRNWPASHFTGTRWDKRPDASAHL